MSRVTKVSKSKQSPKCPDCLEKGVIAQTYHIAGSSLFRCHDCRTMFAYIEFDEIDYTWKSDPEGWKKAKGVTTTEDSFHQDIKNKVHVKVEQ